MKIKTLIKTLHKRPLELPECSEGYGSWGLYWRYNKKIGVKIFRSFNQHDAFCEGNWLIKLNRRLPGVFPKFFCIAPVIYKRTKTAGLFMEHIEGEQMKELGPYSPSVEDQAQLILHKIFAIGYNWDDAMPWNMIITPQGKVRAIDADPAYFRRLYQ